MALTLYVWTDENILIDGPGVPSARTGIPHQRGVDCPVALQFLSGPSADVKVRHATGTIARYGIKASGVFEGPFLSVTTTTGLTEPAVDAEDPFYTGVLSLDTLAVNAAMLTPDGNTGNDKPTIPVGAFAYWLVPGADKAQQTCAGEGLIKNSGFTGTEETPMEAASSQYGGQGALVGTTSTAITFTGAFASAPSAIFINFVHPDGSTPTISAYVDWSTVTGLGFTVRYTSTLPGTDDFFIMWTALL